MDEQKLKILISYCEDYLTTLYQRSEKSKKRNSKNADWYDGILEGARLASGKIINFIKDEMEV